MADQCIVCLESLDIDAAATPQLPTALDNSSGEPPPGDGTCNGTFEKSKTVDSHEKVAVIQVCGHVLHDSCLQEWTAKANSCPICRQSFHLVHVYDRVGGSLLSSRKVEDKKQVAEFDQQAWIEENPDEEEDATPCPVCNLADQEEVLLLCDGCDTPYHTYCIGLDGVPRGAWFCMECAELLGPEAAVAAQAPAPRESASGRRSSFFPRTQASVRQARRRARSDAWQGAWGQISGRVWDALSIDLDYHDDDDALEEYRRSQQRRERERREYQRWQQRLNIASRLGARDVFENSIQDIIAPRPSPSPVPPRPQRVEQTIEERRAWGAFEKALESDETKSSSSRKRKSRSVTASPSEPRQEPERKLKRPRTRRLPLANGESSSSKSSPAVTSNQPEAGSSRANARSPQPNVIGPSFLSSLLKEVEMSTPSDDENIRQMFGPIPGANDPSSPVTSPSASGYNSPRATSITPPPNRNHRPSSPTLSLSSHIEPIYPPANYSPTRSSPDNSDSEHRSHRNGVAELRQPRPRRSQEVKLPRSQDVSPARSPLPLELKENISKIVRSALKPHWQSSQLTAEQYANINRDVSRMLYEGVLDPSCVDDEAKRIWEKTAAKEVARAVSELKV